MKMRLPAQTSLKVRLPDSEPCEKKQFIGLARAIEDMKANFEVQQNEMEAFQQALQSLEEGISTTARHLRAYSENLNRIDVARLGRKARHLANLMEAYEAGA
jgi:septal ring factor EnvC (AmiA/AmiB activator)